MAERSGEGAGKALRSPKLKPLLHEGSWALPTRDMLVRLCWDSDVCLSFKSE